MSMEPVLIAYAASSRCKGKYTYWHRIGEAYPHETGAGLTVVITAVPRDGRIILLELDEDDHDRLAKRPTAGQREQSQ